MIAGDAGLRAPMPRRREAADAAAASTPAVRRPWQYLGDHWRGALPLGLGFWAHGVLLAGLASLVAGALLTWVDITTGPVRWAGLAALLGWPLMLGLQLWAFTGTWRSAAAHRHGGRSTPWAQACRAALVLASAATVASTALHFVPRLPALARLALGSDPLGNIAATVSTDGHRLRLQGWLGIGDAARVLQLMQGAPQARVLELDSPGGRLDEALALAAALRGRGWTVRVQGGCLDACTLVFLAGQVRQLPPDADWSLRRPPAMAFNPLLTRLAKQRLATLYRHAGWPAGLLETALAMPPAYRWRPTWQELADAGVVSTHAHPLDVALPPRTDAPAADYAAALHTNPAWHVLERRFPGSIAEAAGRMQAVRGGTTAGDEALLAAHGVASELLARLLFNAGPEMREQYVILLAQQLQAAREAGTVRCAPLLAGDAAARRGLPAALAARESVWLVDAAAETPRPGAPRKPSAIELEVVRRSLGAEAPALLTGLRHPGDAGARHCERIAALLDRTLQLPHPERRLAIRLMFERP